MRHFVRVFMAMVATTPVVASAYVGTPFITPAMPNARTPISVHIPAGICHAFVDDVDEAELSVVAPGQLRLLIDGIALTPGHPFCIYPEFTYRFDIGILPTGTYTLDLVVYDAFSVPVPTVFANLAFTVSEPASVPAGSRWSWGFAIGLIAVLGGFALRSRYSS